MSLLSTLVPARLRLPRCVWCAGRFTAKDGAVQDGQSAYHPDCASLAHAHTLCCCTGGPWEASLNAMPYGYCLSCGKYRCWVSAAEMADPDYPGEKVNQMLASVPHGVRAPSVVLMAELRWARYRARAEAARG